MTEIVDRPKDTRHSPRTGKMIRWGRRVDSAGTSRIGLDRASRRAGRVAASLGTSVSRRGCRGRGTLIRTDRDPLVHFASLREAREGDRNCPARPGAIGPTGHYRAWLWIVPGPANGIEPAHEGPDLRYSSWPHSFRAPDAAKKKGKKKKKKNKK